MPEIDLEAPGKIVATCDNAKDYTFYIVHDKPWYTPKQFQANPDCVAGKDLYWRSSAQPDDDGKVELDITSEVDAMKLKMKDDPTRKAKLVALATSRPGNEDPNAKLAVAEPYILKKLPPTLEFSIEDDRKVIIVGQKVGIKLVVHGMTEVSIEQSPDFMVDIGGASATLTANKQGQRWGVTSGGGSGQVQGADEFDLSALKNGPVTLTVKATTVGGNKKEAKLELTAEGPKVVIDGMGYVEPENQHDAEDDTQADAPPAESVGAAPGGDPQTARLA